MLSVAQAQSKHPLELLTFACYFRGFFDRLRMTNEKQVGFYRILRMLQNHKIILHFAFCIYLLSCWNVATRSDSIPLFFCHVERSASAEPPFSHWGLIMHFAFYILHLKNPPIARLTILKRVFISLKPFLIFVAIARFFYSDFLNSFYCRSH